MRAGAASDGAARVVGGAFQLGRYQVQGELGRGGMGVVYRGFDPALQRAVAIKMILGEPGDAAAERQLGRFVREARAAAKLRHPGIVAVHEVGEHQGRPFIVMDYIEGEAFDRVLARGKIPARSIAEIAEGVARALEHAHAAGIVHRDVKPQNVIIATDDGRPRLTDFGTARQLGASDSGERLTLTGQMVGTPHYMSPEQARGENDSVGPSSDVYSFGALLYDALAGRPPFEADGILQLMPLILYRDPEPLRSVDPSIHADLETIVAKCLEKEVAARYPSAAAAADDLRRFLDGEAISVRPPGWRDRLRRWARRNRALAATVALAAVVIVGLLVAGVLGAVWSYRRIEAEAEIARRESERAQDEGERARAEGERARAAEQASGEALRQTRRVLAMALAEKATRLAADGRHAEACALAAASLGEVESVEARSVLASSLDAAGRLRWVSTRQDAGPVGAFGPRGERAAVAASGGTIRIWDVEAGEERGLLRGHVGEVAEIAWRPGGDLLASGGVDGTVRLWDPRSVRPIRTIRGHRGRVLALGWSPDGRRLASAGDDGIVRIHALGDDAATVVAAPAVEVAGHTATVRGIAWSPDGRRLVTAGEDEALLLWDVTGDRPVLRHRHELAAKLSAVAWTDEGRRVVVAALDGVVRVVGPDAAAPIEVARADAAVRTLAVAPDGRIAVGGDDATVRILAPDSFDEVARLAGHTGIVYRVSWRPAGDRLLSTDTQGGMRVWDASREPVRPISTTAGHSGAVTSIAWEFGGARVASGAVDGTVVIWDAGTGTLLRRLVSGHAGRITALGWSPDGSRIATAGNDRSLRLIDPESGEELARHDGFPDPWVHDLAWSPEGDRIVAVGGGGFIRMLDAERLETLLDAERRTDHVGESVDWSPDGDHLAISSLHYRMDLSSAYVYDAATLERVAGWAPHIASATAVAWHPDEAGRLAVGYEDGQVIEWDRRSGDPTPRQRRVHHDRHLEQVTALAWRTDGALASSSDDGRVVIRPVGAAARELRAGGPVGAIAWSPDGRSLAAGGQDRSVRVWAIEPSEVVRTLGLVGVAGRASASPDGDSVAIGFASKLDVIDVASGERRFLAELAALPTLERWSPGGAWIAVATGPPAGMLLVPAGGGAPLALAGQGGGEVVDLVWSPDGRRIASMATDRAVRVWTPPTPTPTFVREELLADVFGGAWSPDGRWLAVAAGHLRLHILDGATGEDVAVHEVDDDYLDLVSWDPRGGRLAMGGIFGRLYLVDDPGVGGGAIERIDAHEGQMHDLAFAPDGESLASCGRDRTVRIWEPDSLEQVLVERHDVEVRRLAWGDGGRLLASGDDGGVVRVLDVKAGRPVLALRHDAAILGLTWHERRLLVASDRRQPRLWRIDAADDDPAGLPERVFARTGLRVVGTDAVPTTNRLETAGR